MRKRCTESFSPTHVSIISLANLQRESVGGWGSG